MKLEAELESHSGGFRNSNAIVVGSGSRQIQAKFRYGLMVLGAKQLKTFHSGFNVSRFDERKSTR